MKMPTQFDHDIAKNENRMDVKSMLIMSMAVNKAFIKDNLLIGEVSGGLQGRFDSKIKECEHF